AKIALMNNDLNRLAFLIRLGRRTAAVIHQNLIFGVGFVVTFMVLAGLGKLTPIVGAILHAVGATVVIFNSARLVRFGEGLKTAKPVGEEAPRRAALERVAPAGN
ncbi:MAG: hypothetical protein NT031_12910, partial [Planctomycetota bacterium]|nr:hypothetical protein [Planctomycetota bacterium]